MIDIFQIVRLNELANYYSNIDKFDVNVVNEEGSNLLHEAVAWDRLGIAIDLISRGIDINQQGEKGMTPLQYALEWNRHEIARAIIDAGANVKIRDHFGNSALWTAVVNARGDYEAVELILRKGGDPAEKNEAGRSPLDFAKQANDAKLVTLLTDN